MSERKFCVIDYETRSRALLKKCGAYRYAQDPSTEILCVGWRIGTRAELRQQIKDGVSAHIYSDFAPDHSDAAAFAELQWHLKNNPDMVFVAHNAMFEQVITKFVLGVKTLPPERWCCTASLCRALALPGNLEGAGMALRLPIQKNAQGRKWILKFSKPRKATLGNTEEWQTDMEEFVKFMEYCKTDVDTETLLFLTCPPLSPKEREIWILDQKINMRGFHTDQHLVKQALRLIAEETDQLNIETSLITDGTPSTTTKRNAILRWLHEQGVILPDLRAKTVQDALDAGMVEGEAKRILEIRQSVSKSSTAKYGAFQARASTDGRVRDILVYHTASTGRWGGAGVQPQNFPRGLEGLDTLEAADILSGGDLELVRLIYGRPMGVLSSCLRPVITAPRGRELYCADFAAIEARVLFWLAKHHAGIKGFLENKPNYEEMASHIFSVDFHELCRLVKLKDAAAKAKRQVGKQAFLGSGYGMGWRKFIITCKAYGMDVDEELAMTAINAYRELHYPVVELWRKYEKAAIAAVERKGTVFTQHYTKWWVSKLPGTNLEFLWCELPSGRRLPYFRPKVEMQLTSWGDKRPVLKYYGVDSKTRQFREEATYGGKLTENVVQAVSRDLMAESMLRIDRAGYDIILHAHDEIVAERDKGTGDLESYEELMATLPPWATGCPVSAEGWVDPRYHK